MNDHSDAVAASFFGPVSMVADVSFSSANLRDRSWEAHPQGEALN
jgi:hypothetical protein